MILTPRTCVELGYDLLIVCSYCPARRRSTGRRAAQSRHADTPWATIWERGLLRCQVCGGQASGLAITLYRRGQDEEIIRWPHD